MKAYGGKNAAGIGGSSEYNQDLAAYHIYIEGGAVSAFGGLYAAAIGCGASNRDCGDIRITNASVKTTPGEGAAAIGSGRFVDEATTTCLVTSDGTTPVYLCLIPPAKKTLTIDGVVYTPRHDYMINKVCAYLSAGYHRIVWDGTPRVCLTDADAQDAALKTALESAVVAAKAEAIAAANAALETAKNELSAAIGKKADADTVNAAISNLNTAIANAETAAKAYADAQDAALKTELERAIAAAKETMAAAITALAENVDRAKADLRRALADGDSALEEKIKALEAALNALDEAYRAADRERDAQTEQKTADAKAVMSEASVTLAERLSAVEGRLDTLTVVTGVAIAAFTLFDAAAVVLFLVRRKKKTL